MKYIQFSMLNHIIKIIWAIAITLIFINSIYFSIKLKFPQFRLIKIFKKIIKKDKETGISSKDTFIMALASKTGAGSIAGISFAIFYGGIGTVFWIWISSLFVAINSFLENALAILYKEKDGKFYKGGPSYYIKKGLNKKRLAIIYAVLAICAYIFGFMAIQNNTITTLITDIYSVNKIIIALIVTVIAALAIIKGLKTISKICNTIVPIASIIYIILGIVVIVMNINNIPSVLLNIIKEAFNPKAISGGIIYTFIIGMQKAIFSNEAGIGTSAISSGASSNNDPIKQGYFGILETYFITFILTTITALIVILSNYQTLNIKNINGIEITKYAFAFHFGNFGIVILLIILLLFVFSTIIGVYYIGESNFKNLSNSKILLIVFKIITLLSLFLGGIIPSLFVWQVVDIFVALLAIINSYSVYNLKDVIFKKIKIKL